MEVSNMSDSEKELKDKTASVDEVSVADMDAKTVKPVKAKPKSGKENFFSQIKAEFKKIIWPSRQSLLKQTGVVLIYSVVLGVVITLVDLVIQFGLDLVITK